MTLAEYEEDEGCFRPALSIAAEIGERWTAASNLNRLGEVALELEKIQEARRHFRQALETAWDIGALSVALDSVQGMAIVLLNEGSIEQALKLCACTLHHAGSERAVKDKAQGFWRGWPPICCRHLSRRRRIRARPFGWKRSWLICC